MLLRNRNTKKPSFLFLKTYDFGQKFEMKNLIKSENLIFSTIILIF